ncbi:glycosyl transferase family 2 [Kineococcus xinjiangensis]|uniref:Glycosyl transferase family 2 n=1 Tax=Kineococcus xinjiangensis TaxID=512762 RepID=A0A2S6IM14_9ACTN|nr:glycosyltransferase family A protein [Kineococcus xinjiangensis]PPK95216.1 glycosyl transferase family 2 [Kineococcus xinjiangensis]
MTDRSIDVIIPVRNAAGLLGACLERVRPQLAGGDSIVVVDDASTDDTAEVARRAGARVLSSAQPRGPYAARQEAATASTADHLVFLDVRCRPLPGWLDAHRRLLAEPGTALSCSVVEAVGGRSLASRVAAHQQPFRLEATTGGSRLPYYPTCNLGVLASAFREVGGFRPVRSGGDADLCWRIQQAGLGRLGIDRRTLVHWQPRDRLRDLVEQWYRYGKSSVELDRYGAEPAGHMVGPAAAAPVAGAAAPRGGALATLAQTAQAVRRRQVDASVAALSVAMFGVQRVGRLVALRNAR